MGVIFEIEANQGDWNHAETFPGEDRLLHPQRCGAGGMASVAAPLAGCSCPEAVTGIRMTFEGSPPVPARKHMEFPASTSEFVAELDRIGGSVTVHDPRPGGPTIFARARLLSFHFGHQD